MGRTDEAAVQIVRSDRTMEQIVFPVPSICEFLTKESKLRIYYTTERDEQGSKINDFFLKSEDLFNEMNWQKKLRGGSGFWGLKRWLGSRWFLDNCVQELLHCRMAVLGSRQAECCSHKNPLEGIQGRVGRSSTGRPFGDPAGRTNVWRSS